MHIPNIPDRAFVCVALVILIITGSNIYYLVRGNGNDGRRAVSSADDALLDQGGRAPNPVSVSPLHTPIQVPVASFFNAQKGGLNAGRITDSTLRDTQGVYPGTPLYTVVKNTKNRRARHAARRIHRAYEPSPYAGYFVFLDRLSGIQASKSQDEYIVLRASNSLTVPIAVTGWKLVDGTTNTSYPIPEGARMSEALVSQPMEPIQVKAGETLIISSGRSPTGISFFVNKCSGFQSQFKKFTPTIKTACPEPAQEFVQDGTVPYADSLCYEIVRQLDRCTTVTDIPEGVSKECRTFLENTLTEGGCVLYHRNDPDFFAKEWRIFLETESDLWKNRENVVYLLDENDRLVTALVY